MITRILATLCAGMGFITATSAADLWSKAQAGDDRLLPAETAFQLVSAQREGNAVTLDWVIAPGYYLYRKRFAFEPLTPAAAKLGKAELPPGSTIHDEHFGTTEIYRESLRATLPLAPGAVIPRTLRIRYQGCADAGVCYPPITRVVDLGPNPP